MLQWVSTDLRTGRIIADLPGIVPAWPLRRTIGQYDTATAQLFLDGAPLNWPRAVLEGASVLHVYDDDDPLHTPQWSGIVLQANRNTATDSVDLSLATLEAYTDRRYVGDVVYAAEPQNAIIADLISRFVADSVPTPGLPLTVEYAADSTPRDYVWNDTDNTTVYSRLQQLMALQGGPEWTIQCQWSSDGESILPTLLVADRLGSSAPVGLGPATTWAMPGCLISAQLATDYTAGKGANKVTAYSSGQGGILPTSGPQVATDMQGRPTYEYRWTPSTSVTDPVILTQWALGALKVLGPGAVALTLTGALAASPRAGYDWTLGDDLGYVIGGVDDQGHETVKAFPGGLTGIGRAIAYELGESTIAPILAQASVYTEPT